MNALSLLAHGLNQARRHPFLVFMTWLVPLLPALVLTAIMAANVEPTLGHSLFADQAMGNDAFNVYMEFRTSPADALRPLLSLGVVVMAVITLFAQIILSAGIVEVLAGHSSPYPFVTGVRRNTWPYLRTAILFLFPAAFAAIAAGLIVRAGGFMAEHFGDGRWDLVGVVLAAIVLFAIWAPADLAYDLCRISAVRHQQSSMTKAFLRGLVLVLRRPKTMAPIALVFLAAPILLFAVYSLIRQPWTPATSVDVLLLLLLQQTYMVARAGIKIGIWAAEVRLFDDLGQPQLARPRLR